MTDKLGFGIIHERRARPGRRFYLFIYLSFCGDLFPYFDQIRGDQPNPTQRITERQPLCSRLRRKQEKKKNKKQQKLLKPKPHSSPKLTRKKEIKNTGTPKGLEIFDPLARDFQGQEMVENGRRTVKFFCCTKLDKPIVNKVLFALKDIGNEIQIKPSLASKLRNIETSKQTK